MITDPGAPSGACLLSGDPVVALVPRFTNDYIP